MICKQCSADKPSSDFLWHGKRNRIRVRFCNECSKHNMALYSSTVMVGRKPEEFEDRGD